MAIFTGIVMRGKILDIQQGSGARLHVRGELGQTELGESIAIDGICLTVSQTGRDSFWADVMPETLRRSTLGERRPGDEVNLERALRLSDRLGGHLVTGHIDGVGRIQGISQEENARVLLIQPPENLRPLIAEKGSIAIDGASLTVMDLISGGFRVSLIPHTAGITGLGKKRIGERVNLEADPIARYLYHMKQGDSRGGLMDLLKGAGYL